MFPVELQPVSEVIRAQAFRHDAEGVSLRVIEGKGGRAERDQATQGLGNGVQQGVLREVGDDGVVNLKEGARPLFALPQRLLRLLPLRDIDEGYDGAEGSTLPKDWMGPKLHRKAGAVLSPINLVVSMNALAVLKTYVNGALLDRIRPAVCPSVVFERMHVFSEQFGGIVIAEQAHRGGGIPRLVQRKQIVKNH